MKKNRFILLSWITLVVFTLGFVSCEEDAGDDTNGPTEKTVLSQVLEEYSEGESTYSRTLHYSYDSLGYLVKIEYDEGQYTYWDTIKYEGGKIKVVETFEPGNGTPWSTLTFAYTDNLLTSLTVSEYDYVKVLSFEYISGKLSHLTVTYTTGTADEGEVTEINNIVWSGNNMSTLDVTMQGMDPVNATGIYDNYPNPLPRIDPDDFIGMFCENNMIAAYMTSNPEMIFVSNEYTYANGRVATVVSGEEGGTRTATLSYSTILVYQ